MSPIPMRQSRRRLMLAARIPNSLLILIDKSHPLAWTKIWPALILKLRAVKLPLVRSKR